jgi:hypothetical protein
MTNSKEILNLNSFTQLAKVHEPVCLSLYLPTYRAGQEVKQELAPKTLKNLLKAVRSELAEREMSDNEIEAFLRPVVSLLDDKKFWTEQSDGLCIFLTESDMEYYKIPIPFDPVQYVADHFYLKPLVPMLNRDDVFYLLAFSPEMVHLYECTPYTIAEIESDELPGRLEDVVGYDKVPDNLQQRSGQDAHGGAVYHGHGSKKDTREVENRKFLHAVDNAVNKILTNQTIPLILAADEKNAGRYRKINEYNTLVDDFIPGNPEGKDTILLHEIAYDKLKPQFDKHKQAKIDAFLDNSTGKKAMSEMTDIVPASVNGRVDTLFMRNDKEAYGLFDKENNSVIIDDSRLPQNASLYNMMAVNTILNKGNVYLMDADEMPLANTNANALLRY